MLFIISFQVFVANIVRLPKFAQFMNELLGYFHLIIPEGFTGISAITYNFFLFEHKTNKYIRYNGQLMVLEYVLNHVANNGAFTAANIAIEDASRSDFLYFHNKGESFGDVHMSNKDEPDAEPVWMSNIEEFNAEFDFIVRVHLIDVTSDHKEYIRTIVDKFKIAGKNYAVLALNE